MQITEEQVRLILNNWDGVTSERLVAMFTARYVAPYTTAQVLDFLGIAEAVA
jgi:hypothetical protein